MRGTTPQTKGRLGVTDVCRPRAIYVRLIHFLPSLSTQDVESAPVPTGPESRCDTRESWVPRRRGLSVAECGDPYPEVFVAPFTVTRYESRRGPGQEADVGCRGSGTSRVRSFGVPPEVRGICVSARTPSVPCPCRREGGYTALIRAGAKASGGGGRGVCLVCGAWWGAGRVGGVSLSTKTRGVQQARGCAGRGGEGPSVLGDTRAAGARRGASRPVLVSVRPAAGGPSSTRSPLRVSRRAPRSPARGRACPALRPLAAWGGLGLSRSWDGAPERGPGRRRDGPRGPCKTGGRGARQDGPGRRSLAAEETGARFVRG